MVNKIVLFFLMFSFLIGYSQIPKINKSFSINKYINSFIKVNNDSNFKPNKSLIHLFARSEKEKKQYIIFISRDNIESTLIKENSDYLEFYKYRNFDLLLQGKTLEDIYFLKKIIICFNDFKDVVLKNIDFNQKFSIKTNKCSY